MKRRVINCSIVGCVLLVLTLVLGFFISRSLAVAAAEEYMAEAISIGWESAEVKFEPKIAKPQWVIRYAGPVEDDKVHIYEFLFLMSLRGEITYIMGPMPHVDSTTGEWKKR